MIPGSIEFRVDQSPSAVERYSLDCGPDLPPGASVSASGHTVTHTPPRGGATTTPTIAVSGNTATITIGPLTAVGLHKLEAVVAYDNSGGVKAGAIWWINVP
jgi:hypothetical protein